VISAQGEQSVRGVLVEGGRTSIGTPAARRSQRPGRSSEGSSITDTCAARTLGMFGELYGTFFPQVRAISLPGRLPLATSHSLAAVTGATCALPGTDLTSC